MKRPIIGLLLIVGILLIAIPLIVLAIGNNNGNSSPTPTPTPTATPGGSFTYEGILLGVNEGDDYDGDGISDRIEYWQLHADPEAIYTNNNPIDDFNAVYTYGLNPLNSTEIAEFMDRIPNVEAKVWVSLDKEWIAGGRLLTEGEVVEIGMRDPVVQYYARQVSIEWQDAGHNIGSLKLNSQPLFVSYEVTDAMSVSYYFTHGRKGGCGKVNMAHAAVLSLMGYKSKCLWGAVESGESHGWAEVVIDGVNYVVSYNLIAEADNFYRDNKWTINGSCSID